jgi:hypothetical protein
VRWSLIVRDGNGWRTDYSENNPSINRWYSVELHWRGGSVNGVGELFVDGESVASVSGVNTGALGDADLVRFGLAEVYSCGSTVVYADSFVMATSEVGLEQPFEGVFADGFESGGFAGWSGVSTSSGETAMVSTSISHDGVRSGRFASNGGGGFESAYGYQSIAGESELYARGFVYVSQSGIAQNNDRFYFIRFRSGGNDLAYAGWRMVNGEVRWSLIVRDGTGWVSVYSDGVASLNRWYGVELHWRGGSVNGVGELFVDGESVASVSGVNTAALGDVNLVRFGLAEVYNCGSTTVYADSLAVATTQISTEQ